MYNRFLCRGKRLDNGQWVYGSCVYNGELIFANRAFICPSVTAASSLSFDNKTKLDGFVLGEFCEADPSTVGRCTGLSAAKSYRGTEPRDLLVFEGDVVYIPDWQCQATVYWYHGAWMLRFPDNDEYLYDVVEECEIVSNIYDEAAAD